MVIVISEELDRRARVLARTVGRAPFVRRTWSELWFLIAGGVLAVVGLAIVGITMLAGIVLAVTFFGVAFVGLSLRIARGTGRIQRHMAHGLVGEEIDDPAPFAPRPGFLGWLQSALRDRTAWRSLGYLTVKVPLTIVGVFTAFSVWFDAFTGLLSPLMGGHPRMFGLPVALLPSDSASGFGAFVFGVVLLFVAPWPVRVVVYIDRLLMRTLLGPDAVDPRMRSLERARTQTVDASAATLRRIERDLHDGTQAQLVAVAMRLGMAKEKLADSEHLDLDNSLSSCTMPIVGPRRRLSNCVTWREESTRLLSTPASRARSPPWPPAVRCRPT